MQLADSETEMTTMSVPPSDARTMVHLVLTLQTAGVAKRSFSQVETQALVAGAASNCHSTCCHIISMMPFFVVFANMGATWSMAGCQLNSLLAMQEGWL